MTDALLALLAATLYLAAAGALARALRSDPDTGRGLYWLAAPALVAHLAAHVLGWSRLHGPDLHFFAALSLVAWGMGALGTLAAATQRMAALGVIVYPLAAALSLLYAFAGHGHPSLLDWRLQLHALLALLAYATLSLASLIALLLWLQDRALRARRIPAWLRALPPLVQLEALLFRTLWVAFVLLSATLLTGVLFVEDLLAQHLWHKTVLSVLSWLVLGALLLGRWRYGWRGGRAIKLVLTSMFLLALAFFGSQFVLQMVLHKA
jgi:ABC-type uncharacterized transport system permease subunit